MHQVIIEDRGQTDLRVEGDDRRRDKIEVVNL